MENVVVLLTVFAISFFVITSVGSNRAIELYNKINSIQSPYLSDATAIRSNRATSLFSSLYRAEDSVSTPANQDNAIKIKSIDRIVSREIDADGVMQGKRLSVYLLFTNPSLKKDGNDWRMHVAVKAVTKDKDGKLTKFLNGSPLQEINNKYSYKLDSGAFVFNLNLSGDTSEVFNSTFIVHDILSGKRDKKTVDIKI